MSAKTKLYLIARSIWRKGIRQIIERLKPTLPNWDVLSQGFASERIVENPFIFLNLSRVAEGARILDVGYRGSTVIAELAALNGFACYAIDIRKPFRYPRTHIVRGSICEAPFKSAFFDVILATSTLEHIGLREPYGDSEDSKADLVAVHEMIRTLKTGGMLLLTVPYGRATPWSYFRVYNRALISRLSHGLKLEEEEYYARSKDGKSWEPCDRESAERVYSTELANAVALLRFRKEISS
jgi:SAM-dependent methyltransferase